MYVYALQEHNMRQLLAYNLRIQFKLNALNFEGTYSNLIYFIASGSSSLNEAVG